MIKNSWNLTKIGDSIIKCNYCNNYIWLLNPLFNKVNKQTNKTCVNKHLTQWLHPHCYPFQNNKNRHAAAMQQSHTFSPQDWRCMRGFVEKTNQQRRSHIDATFNKVISQNKLEGMGNFSRILNIKKK